MVTNISQKILVIQTADCQSVLIYDPIQHVAANVHAGWRGSINDTVGRPNSDGKKFWMPCAKYDCRDCTVSWSVLCIFINYKTKVRKTF